jgi:hypothetical protein
MMNSAPAAPALVPIRPGRPFFGMVNTFMASAMGLGPYFDPVQPLKPNSTSGAVFYGFYNPMSALDTIQVVNKSLAKSLTAAEALNTLCCMLVISTFKVVKAFVDNSPEFQVFYHLRNAAYHQNKFNFRSEQPKHPASWRTFRIDDAKKGNMNPLHGKPCFGTSFGPADVLLFLADIDKKLA